MGCLAISTALAEDFTFGSIGRGVYYEQFSSGNPVLRTYRPYLFNAEARTRTNAPTFAGVLVPGEHFGDMMFCASWEDGFFYRYYRSADQAELDTRYPNGDYTIGVEYAPGVSQFITNTLTEGSFPNAPAIANLAAAQSVDPANEFELTWSPFAGGTGKDFISCQLQQVESNVFSTPFFGSPGALDGTATSMVIPAGALLPGRAYLGRLVFGTMQSIATNHEAGTVGATFYFSQTDFWLKTRGSGDNTPPAIAWTSPTNGATGAPPNTPITVHFTKPMRTSGYHYGVTGMSSGGGCSVQYSPDGLQVVLTPIAPLTGSPVLFFNPFTGSLPAFGDLNGNPLAPDTLVVSYTAGPGYLVPIPASLSALQPQSGGRFQIALHGEPSYSYILEHSTDLAQWSPVATNVAFGGTAIFIVTNTTPTGAPLLYRAVAR